MCRIIFMGTPGFAVESLSLLIEEGFEIPLVITQPDRPGNRKKMTPAPVKLLAQEKGLEIITPENVNDPDVVEKIKEARPDFIVVVAFGQKIGKELLEFFDGRIINVHSSILPRYRGAAPINWAIIEGEKVSGATIMLIDEKLDRGDILHTLPTDIEEDETAVELEEKIRKIGARGLVEVLQNFDDFYKNRRVQKEEEASYRGFLTKKMGKINWSESAEEIYNKFRGLKPWPGMFFVYEDQNVKVHKMNIIKEYNKLVNMGEVAEVSKDRIVVAAAQGAVEIYELQFPGKKRMTVEQFLAGNTMPKGINLYKEV
ncbi:MAG: methionyl-tRNA formyltransferase [Gallicola sp.]|nr:methionyl-tRNA formyltransferase [Gallicola sp.]